MLRQESLALLVLGNDLIQLIHHALVEIVQSEIYTSILNGIWDTVCMQVLEQFKVALFLVVLAQPCNRQLPVLEGDSLNVLYIHYNYYVTPAYMIK